MLNTLSLLLSRQVDQMLKAVIKQYAAKILYFFLILIVIFDFIMVFSREYATDDKVLTDNCERNCYSGGDNKNIRLLLLA